MAPTIAIAIFSVAVYWVIANVVGLRRNIAAAKACGLPYFVMPINIYNMFWLTTHKFWLRFIDRLPKAWTENWLPFILPNWVWTLQFEPFKEKGDVFLTVSPGGINVWLANAEAIHQVTATRDAFPSKLHFLAKFLYSTIQNPELEAVSGAKILGQMGIVQPLESYKILDIFGRSLVSTEGAEWKTHRKITSPGFNEKNNALVFAESCRQAQGMLMKWTGRDGVGNITLTEVPTDTMRLALHIISRVGFGVRLLWPGESMDEKENDRNAVYGSNDPPEGHSMSFEHALDCFLANMVWVLLTPKWLLKRLPFKSAQLAYESFINWSQYMNELFYQKIDEAREGKHGEGMDIMGSLVRSSYGDSRVSQGRKQSPGLAEKAEPILSDSDILGNAFVMILAGHETTANSIHFSLVELAANPKSQRLVQKEVQSIFGNTPPGEWDYESNINALLGGIVGAVLNEELRLMPPVIAIPKRVPKTGAQPIFLGGKQFILPPGAHIALDSIGVHRNPKYWPSQPSKVSSRPHDLYDFRPERWLVNTSAAGVQVENATSTEDDGEDYGGFTGQSSAAELFRPVKGSYIPFSEGARSCIGRRLAQVEVMAVLAVIFQTYSIELAIDATDDEVAKMSDNQKIEVYKKAQDKSRTTIRGATTIITLKLHPGHIPVRLVRKGEERFINIID